ncbi:MAG: hypothetical protein NT007_05035 [Candidatus Kapabacteria bacterium]|nr:hypothetical protein [Candidatus Kapabacteria bacterium]
MPYSPYIADYFGGLNKLSIIVKNNTNKQQKIKIGYTIEGDNGVKVSSKAVFIPPQPLILNPNQIAILNNSNMKNYSDTKNFDVVGFSKTTLMQTGMLPEGNYNFCFRAYDYTSGLPLSPTSPSGCAPVDIAYPEAPILIQPNNEDTLLSTNILFSWIGSPQAPMGTQFKLQMTEMLLPNGSPDAVMNSTSRFFYEKTLSTTSYLSLPNDPPLIVGKTYAWRVIAIDPSKKIQFRNSGVSEARKFTLKTPDVILFKKGKSVDSDTVNKISKKSVLITDTTTNLGSKKSLTDPNKSGKLGKSNIGVTPPSATIAQGSLNPNDTLKAGQNGEFTIIANSITMTNNKYSGKGTCYINWLKARVDVEFDSITVDTTKRLLKGQISGQIDNTAPVYPKDWALEIGAHFAFTNNMASSVVDWVKNKFNQTIPYNGLTAYTNPVKLPLGLNFPDSSQFAITEMAFTRDTSQFVMVAAKTTPASWGDPQLVGFRAMGIRFHPAQIQLPPARIELLEDVTIGNTNANIVLSMKKPDDNHSGCYVEWDETGFSEFGVELEAKFTRDWLIPSPDSNNQATATLVGIGSDWYSMILTGWMKKSEIVGTNGMTILADSLSYDLSDDANPASIVFPPNYAGDKSVLFHGFFMKNLTMVMPETWKTMNNTAPTISLSNMIIDKMGLTFSAKATNVIQFPSGKVADLEASIDTIVVKMVASSLTEAYIKGKIGLPAVKKDSVQHPLKYTALFNNVNKSFQLSIVPTGPIYAHLFKGTLDLAQTSNITAFVDKTTKKFDMILNGSFGWNNIQLGPVKNVNIGLKFQNLGFNYNSAGTGFKFNAGTWAFASAQKFMANFPVTIKNIGFSTLTSAPGEMLRGKLNFDVIFNLTDIIGGMTKLGVILAIEDGTAAHGQKFYPKYINTTLDSISIHSNMSAAKIEGSVAFFNNDPTYGDGFKGDISAKFNSVNLYVAVGAFFGNKTNSANVRYRYWKVEALVILPPPGIVFMAGLAFRGFGAGAYHHMTATYNAVNLPPPSNNSNMSTTSGAVFTPNDNVAFGFKIKAIIATTPKEQTFNGEAGISGEFFNNGGMSFLRFDGAFWVGAGFTEHNKAFMNGAIAANYDFTLKKFLLQAAVGINKDPITTPVPLTLEFMIDSKNNLWHFIAGTPTHPNTVKVAGIPLTSYAMFGNDIIPPPNFMPQTIAGYAAATNGGSLGSLDGSKVVNSETKAGKGFAFGVGINDHGADGIGIIGRFSINWTYSIGGELNLSLMEYSPGCITGMSGWYAKGNVALYGGFSVVGHLSAKGRLHHSGESQCTNSTCLAYCCYNYHSGHDFNVGSFGFGVWASGGFPHPTYLEGGCDIHYSAIDDIVTGTYHGTFKFGNACADVPVGVPSTGAQEYAADEQQAQLIKTVLPVGNNIDTATTMKATYGFTPSESFDVAERQADGTVKTRTFQAIYSVKLEKYVNGSPQLVNMLEKGVNALGQYEFTNIFSPVINNNPATGATLITNLKKTSNSGTLPSNSYANKLPATNAVISTGGIKVANGTDNDNNTTPPPVDPGYGNLPPTPPSVVNHLERNMNYRFTVQAVLFELVAGNWNIATNHSNQPVIQVKYKDFRTGAMQVANANVNDNTKQK